MTIPSDRKFTIVHFNWLLEKLKIGINRSIALFYNDKDLAFLRQSRNKVRSLLIISELPNLQNAIKVKYDAMITSSERSK